ncbi:MAG: LysM peptidoglycan-binding domain-containing protein [Planctomycetota bacterium]
MRVDQPDRPQPFLCLNRWVWVLPAATALALVGCESTQSPTVESFPPPPAQFGYVEPGPAAAESAPVASGDAVFVPVAPVDQRVGAAAPLPGAGGSYTVQKGDTLWSIASRVYGNGQRHKDILAANPQVNPNRLLVGQTLVIP